MIKSMIRNSFLIFFITIILFIIIDVFLGNYLKNKFVVKYIEPEKYRIQHDIFHHSFLKNFKTDNAAHVAVWGKNLYSLCTDNNGFKTSCNNSYNGNFFDLVFIGDSVTEGIGYKYEDTFVGLTDKKLNNLKIANLAVSSYSPAIYYAKINYLLSEGFTFNEVIVFIDLSDIQDEAIFYSLQGNKAITAGGNDRINNYLKIKNEKIQNETWNTSITEKIKHTNKTLGKNMDHLKRTYYVNFVRNHLPYTYNYSKLFLKFFLRIIGILQPEIKKSDEAASRQRAEWTYNTESNYYGPLTVSGGIKNAKDNMEKLYLLLNKKNIPLSIAVYPWPGQLKYDVQNNLQVKIWREFCMNKCKKFYDLMPYFFKEVSEIGYEKTYYKYYIPGDIHFNKEGNVLIARKFFEIYSE